MYNKWFDDRRAQTNFSVPTYDHKKAVEDKECHDTTHDYTTEIE